jgi:hypothetical protein
MIEPPVPPRPEPSHRLPAAPPLERLRQHWEDPRVRVGALLLGALVAGLLWYQLGAGGTAAAGPPVTTTPSTAAGGRVTAGSTATPSTPAPPSG